MPEVDDKPPAGTLRTLAGLANGHRETPSTQIFDPDFRERQIRALARIRVIDFNLDEIREDLEPDEEIVFQPISEGTLHKPISVIYTRKPIKKLPKEISEELVDGEIFRFYLVMGKKAIPVHELWAEDESLRVLESHCGSFLYMPFSTNYLFISRDLGNSTLNFKLHLKIEELRLLEGVQASGIPDSLPHAEVLKNFDKFILFIFIAAIVHEYAHHLQIKPGTTTNSKNRLTSQLRRRKQLANSEYAETLIAAQPHFKRILDSLRIRQAQIERNANAFVLSFLKKAQSLGFDLITAFGGLDQVLSLIEFNLEIASRQNIAGDFPFTNAERGDLRQKARKQL